MEDLLQADESIAVPCVVVEFIQEQLPAFFPATLTSEGDLGSITNIVDHDPKWKVGVSGSHNAEKLSTPCTRWTETGADGRHAGRAVRESRSSRHTGGILGDVLGEEQIPYGDCLIGPYSGHV